MKLTNQVVLVTGANRGLGSHLVTQVLSAGAAKVYATARDVATLPEDLRSDPRVVVLAIDITDPDSIATAAARAGDLNVLINNAGVLSFGDVLTGDLDGFERDLTTNYLGTLRCSRAFVPVIHANGPGAIANVLTLIALAPVAPMAGYSASKAAAHSMTQALRAAVADRGIEVLGAYPGGIDTDMLAGVEAEKAPPEEVARRIVAALEEGRSLVFPDDASAGASEVYLADPVRLEMMLAG